MQIQFSTRLRLAGAAVAALVAFLPVAAQAEDDAGPFKLSGSVGLVSDYRFRGVSQTDKHMAVQGGMTLSHESGLYVSVWGSNLAGWGTFGGANMELDLVGGFTIPLGDVVTLDAGLLWYMYPGGADNSDFAEPYIKVSGALGPVSLLGGIAYAPKQYALANVSNHPDSHGQNQDNLYVWGDGSYAIEGLPLPLKAKAHLGYSHGNPGLGPNGTSVTPTGSYWDWSLGGETSWRNLTFGVSWVDTSISWDDSLYLQPNFSKGNDGTGSIAGSTVLFSLTAAF